MSNGLWDTTKFTPEDSLWNFWENGCSQSMINLWLSCRESAKLAMIEGWTSKKSSRPLEFGSCVHWILSHYPKLPKKNIGKLLKKYNDGPFFKDNPMLTMKKQQEQEQIYAAIEALIPVYCDYWKNDWDTKTIRPVSGIVVPRKWHCLEERFKVPFTFRDKVNTWMVGCFDGVFSTHRDGKDIWLFETKTKSMIDPIGIEECLHVDFQVMYYLTALWKRYKKKPKGVLYNIIRNPGMRISANPSIDELQDYRERIRKDAEKRPEHYFMRFQYEPTTNELKRWKKEVLSPIMNELRDWWNGSEPHYFNASSLVSKYGRSHFYGPIVNNDYSEHYRRKFVFKELEDV